MKRLIYIASLLIAMSSCTQNDIDSSVQTDSKSRDVVVRAGLNTTPEPDESSTKVTVSQGEFGVWRVRWNTTDKLGGWSSDASDTKLHKYTMLPKDYSYSDQLDFAEFGGTTSGAKLRLIYPYTDSTIVNGLLPISLRSQRLDYEEPYENVGDYIHLISEKEYDLDGKYYVESPMMVNLGAVIDVNLQYADKELNRSYSLIAVELGGGDAESYAQVPIGAKVDPSATTLDEVMVEPQYGENKVAISNHPYIESGLVYTIPMAILPFQVEAGKKLKVTLHFSIPGVGDYQTQVVDIENTTGRTIDYARGHHHYLNVSVGAGAEGNGSLDVGNTKENPYLIESADSLRRVFEYIRQGENYSDKYFKLTKSIDLGCGSDNSWYAERTFNGNFDGNGQTISGMYSTSSGLFDYIASAATISNLTIEGAFALNSLSSFGGLCRYNSGKIINCHTKGSLEFTPTSSNYYGGITGNNSGIITNCSNSMTLKGLGDTDYGYVGGIAGGNTGAITLCHNSGYIRGTKSRAGGIVGSGGENSRVISSYNSGNISGVDDYVGGIVGYSDNKNVIINCYNTAWVTATDTYTEIGGITGITLNNSSIVNCYNIGTITSAEYSETGGIVGYRLSTADHTVCYNAGTINGGSVNYTGAIVGCSTEGYGYDTYNCYLIGSAQRDCGDNKNYSTMNIDALNEDDMKASSFVETLNAEAAKYNEQLVDDSTKACKWIEVAGGYPTLDFNTEAGADVIP